MSSKFNARVSFKGEGSVSFVLPTIGEVTVYNGRDIYIKNATQAIIEQLRQYRTIKVEHKLNADVKGCYSVIDVDEIVNAPTSMFRSVMMEKKQASMGTKVSDLKSELKSGDFTQEEIAEFTPVVEAGQSTAKEIEAKEVEKKAKLKEETNQKVEKEETVEESVEETEKVVLSEELANYEVTTTNLKGKKLGTLNERELKKLARYSNDANEKAKAKQALDILFPSNK